MGLNMKWVHGALVYHDGQRWFEAVGEKVSKFLEDFVTTPFTGADAPSGYTVTLVEVGAGETTVALKAGADNGALVITADANDNDGANVQALGEAFKLASGKPVYFGVKFQVSEATQSDFLLGLAITTTDALGGVTDGIYFRKVDASTTCNLVLEKDSAETEAAAVTIAAATDYVLEFYFDGTNVDFWVNGVQGTRPAMTNLPDDEWLSPVMHFLNGAAGAGKNLEIDWIKAIQINA
jgi:hypothetical protein